MADLLSDAGRLLDSIDRHFLAGCPALSASQLEEHEMTGACRECTQRAQAARRERGIITAATT